MRGFGEVDTVESGDTEAVMTRTSTRARRGRSLAFAPGVALAVAATVTLAGCASSTPQATLDSAAATERYQPVVDDLVAALTDAYPTVTWSDDSETRVTGDDGDDGCSLAIGTQRADPSLPDTAGTWTDVLAVVNPVLTEHGFGEVDDEESLEGGWTGLRSTDDDTAAELRFADKGYTLLSLSVDVTDTDC
jgi:DNA-binding transcriptional LysR family regulator